MARSSRIALTLLAALLLPLGAPLWASHDEAHGCCCAGSGLCHKSARAQRSCRKPSQELPRQLPMGEAKARECHGQGAATAAPVVLRRGCSGGGDPATPAPSRDDHRSPAIRLHSRTSLPPGAFVAAGSAPAVWPGFSEPPKPPPRQLA